ncbi:unnamed protein product [Ostreobium quekettii]|uniref:Uncharacterized protein n=1 Tax=Ostreobium quekettii TaxID=121088 RepID=A0A8S1IZN9_9CHLO|nr:unnamed protein product [Ostreobium quekettii]
MHITQVHRLLTRTGQGSSGNRILHHSLSAERLTFLLVLRGCGWLQLLISIPIRLLLIRLLQAVSSSQIPSLDEGIIISMMMKLFNEQNPRAMQNDHVVIYKMVRLLHWSALGITPG